MDTSQNEEHEIEGLLQNNGDGSKANTATTRLSRPTGSAATNKKNFNKILTILAIGTISLISMGIFFHSTDVSKDQAFQGRSAGLPHLTCPKENEIEMSLNDIKNDSITDFYENEHENAVLGNQTSSSLTLKDIDKLKQHNYDGWTRTFNVMKEERRSWKERMFKSLRSGDSICEVACGRGFNLLLTAEVLKEDLGIDNLNIYGIEYVLSSVDIANQVLEMALAPIGSRLGTICRGDATNLFFVEDESFDLVYTGYIDPITDPLDLKAELGREHEADDICGKRGKGGWAKTKLAKLDQKAQEDWYAAWVVELVRVAKKGRPIIVEQVSLSLCDGAPNDWGGVSKDWWAGAVSTYGWDVDVDSIIIENSRHSTNKETYLGRYNVFMRKNNYT